ncbi:hypothetical protein HY523_01965, partial [Candidatus Berkelbacteria bacterium]|nr:hypothetical protein [Candidatus Berkelbacteria bacterium]
HGGVPIGAKGPRHEGHTSGIHADLWIPHLEHADTYGYAFDLQMAREFAQLLKSHREVKVVIFDDYTLEKEGLVQVYGGHLNHWHLTIE